MIRESKQELFCLSVGKQSVERWKKKIEQLETEIRHILSEEKNETQIRRLEIMHKKAENMMEHLDDIKRKPRK